MKPLVLTMEAFGSYGKQTTIDFREPNQNLFLITGDTGSGKTTIFDAIVFALYGESSSSDNKKSGQELQSQFTTAGVEPFVDLLFTEGTGDLCEQYRIRRIPKHIRPKKRRGGADYTSVSESVELTMPDGTIFPGKNDEIDLKIKEILGLEKDQFMKVGMIAQGEFMKLLRDSSKDKKAIFQKLFHTEIYDDFVMELKRRMDAKSGEMESIFTECRTEAGHVLIPEGFEKEAELRKLKERISSAKTMAVVDMEKLLEELKVLCTYQEEQLKSIREMWKQASDERDRRMKVYNQADSLEQLYGQWAAAKKLMDECKLEEDDIKEKEKSAVLIRNAYEVKAVYGRLEDISADLKSEKDRKIKLQEQAPDMEAKASLSAEEEKRAKEAADIEAENYARISEKVTKAEDTFAQIKDAEAKQNEKKSAADTSDEKYQAAKKAAEELKDAEQEWRKQAAELADANTVLATWNAENEKAEEAAVQIKEAKQLAESVKQAEKSCKQAKEAYVAARDTYAAHHADYESKRNAYLDEQAGFLAAEKLKKGQPCPVCGSLEHPNPCRISKENENITRGLLDEMAKQDTRLQEEHEQKARTAELAIQNARTKKEEYDAALGKILEYLQKNMSGGSDPSTAQEEEGRTLSAARDKLKAWQESLHERGETAEANAEKLKQVNRSLEGIDEKRSTLDEAVEDARVKAENAQTACKEIAARLEALRGSLEYGSFAEAEEAKKDAKDAKDAKEKLYKTARTNADQAKTEWNNVLTQIHTLEESIPKKEKLENERKADYLKSMEEKDLSELEWKTITEKHDKGEEDILQKNIQIYMNKLTSAKAALKVSEEGIAGRERPDLAALVQARDEADDKFNEINDLQERVRGEYKSNKNAYEALAPRMESHAGKLKELSRLSGMYARFAGNQTGARMDIETFVQRYYLEKILDAANVRFSNMSAGQYELRMYDLDKASEGKNHGLDLMVYSAVTGKEREVRTLSGGESFMAALALALGMADEIQEHSSAIHLDVMFIDEGFGSLDETSRNQAIKVLQSLAGGERMIGIISHVTELKQAIDNQLIVTKDEHGSTARWQIS